MGTNVVHLFNGNLTLPAPSTTFTAVPGYDTGLTFSPNTTFPFRLYTNGSRQIGARSSATGTSLNCMTDGWVLHPAS